MPDVTSDLVSKDGTEEGESAGIERSTCIRATAGPREAPLPVSTFGDIVGRACAACSSIACQAGALDAFLGVQSWRLMQGFEESAAGHEGQTAVS
jgi:hypothetical protein